jgi:ribose transport system permease protein
MLLTNSPSSLQSAIRGMILLIATAIDSVLNPRDEQTAQQSDI